MERRLHHWIQVAILLENGEDVFATSLMLTCEAADRYCTGVAENSGN
jgi:hypothetical protein